MRHYQPSRVGYIRNRWPLIELGMSRADCRGRLAAWGIDAPRSACCGCPLLSNTDWRERREQPEWATTLAIAARLEATGQFMHHSRRPLADVDLRSWDERGQPDLFGEECEGMCGT